MEKKNAVGHLYRIETLQEEIASEEVHFGKEDPGSTHAL